MTALPTISGATYAPSAWPSSKPSNAPVTVTPSSAPVTQSPTTASPSGQPTTVQPTFKPTSAPSTVKPTWSPTTAAPTAAGYTYAPSTQVPTASPTTQPTFAPISLPQYGYQFTVAFSSGNLAQAQSTFVSTLQTSVINPFYSSSTFVAQFGSFVASQPTSTLSVVWMNPTPACNANDLNILSALLQARFPNALNRRLLTSSAVVSIVLFCDNAGSPCTSTPTAVPTSTAAAGGTGTVSSSGSSGSSTGAIVAAIIVVIVIIVIIVIVVVYLNNKKKNEKEKQKTDQTALASQDLEAQAGKKHVETNDPAPVFQPVLDDPRKDKDARSSQVAPAPASRDPAPTPSAQPATSPAVIAIETSELMEQAKTEENRLVKEEAEDLQEKHALGVRLHEKHLKQAEEHHLHAEQPQHAPEPIDADSQSKKSVSAATLSFLEMNADIEPPEAPAATASPASAQAPVQSPSRPADSAADNDSTSTEHQHPGIWSCAYI